MNAQRDLEDADSQDADLTQWKSRLEQLFEDLQNFDLPDQILDDFEAFLNETVHLKESHAGLEDKLAAFERDVFFLRSENAALKANTADAERTKRALEVIRLPPVSIAGGASPVKPGIAELATPRASIPQAPVLLLTPKSLPVVAAFKPKYKLLFWTKTDPTSVHTVFSPTPRLSGFLLHPDHMAKFVPVKDSPAQISVKRKATVASVLPQRRALVIETALKALSLSPDTIVGKLLTCDSGLCGNYEKLSVLYSALPREEDFAAVQPLLSDPTASPGQAEAFVIALSSISGLKTLVDSIVFKATFDLNRTEMEVCLGNWVKICSRLRENEDLRCVLQVLLVLGNAFNEGHPRLGVAKGYKLDILEELAGLRSPQEAGVSILDVVIALFFTVKGERVKFYSKEEFALLREVACANFATTVNSCNSLFQQYHTASKADFSQQFRSQMASFLSQKKADVLHLQALLDDCTAAVKETHRYFCESEETDADGCFLLFRHLSRFYELSEAVFQKLAVGKTGKRGSKRYTLTPAEPLSLRRMSRLQE